jgi:hypothetical protein
MMIHSTNTERITLELDEYLRGNDYFDDNVTSTLNQQIVASWEPGFKEALVHDITSRFKDIGVDIVFSEFDLSSEDDQGACVFFHKAVLVDSETLEFLKVFIKTLVNYHKTVVYLDSSYANTHKWTGKSKALKQIFDKLKTADKKAGYFSPITLKALVTD